MAKGGYRGQPGRPAGKELKFYDNPESQIAQRGARTLE